MLDADINISDGLSDTRRDVLATADRVGAMVDGVSSSTMSPLPEPDPSPLKNGEGEGEGKAVVLGRAEVRDRATLLLLTVGNTAP